MGLRFITTGGTIDKDYATTKGTRSLSISEPAIHRIISRIPTDIEYTVTELFKIDSLDMTESHRREIADEIRTVPEDNIIITHGTDSIIETGKYLQQEDLDKSIVLVGSSKPETFKNSDADINVGGAMTALDLIGDEVKISIHSCLYNPEKTRKNKDGKFVRESEL